MDNKRLASELLRLAKDVNASEFPDVLREVRALAKALVKDQGNQLVKNLKFMDQDILGDNAKFYFETESTDPAGNTYTREIEIEITSKGGYG